ncbi:cadherin-11 [Trichomycterus rosablanca]|uniref:cadherin-11 n=1 Tax=Trichomycterus rosablanca TaxID=2290929 RepID=UPI002F35676E
MLMSRSGLLVLGLWMCVCACTEETSTDPLVNASSISETSQSSESAQTGQGGSTDALFTPPSGRKSGDSDLIKNSHTGLDPHPNSTDFPQYTTPNSGTVFQGVADGPERPSRRRRSWIWNQFFVIEEYSGPEPVLIGRLRSSLDRGEGHVLYVLSGEGAGSVFVIDGQTGNIHVTKPLDREEKDQYRLVATATDGRTGHALEASSQFIIRVQDINDNPPKFTHTHYSASVPERASAGTSVIQVTATDADDQSYGNSAKLVYSVVQGQQHFTVDPHTGVVRTATSDMDREVQAQYVLVLEARDMAGHQGGLTGTTSITVNLSDVNDNPPRFTQRLWVFSVSELALPGVEVGRVSASDADVGENAELVFTITDGDGRKVFNISGLKQQGVILLNQVLDFETHSSYTLSVEVQNPRLDVRFLRGGVFRDEAVVRITVLNADEPPQFTHARYHLNISENCRAPCSVGRVHAVDPDTGLSTNVEYSIDPASDPSAAFRISPVSGLITAMIELDREREQWRNITVIASQRDSPDQVTRVAVAIETLDVNDNPPVLDRQYDTAVCDSGTAGQVIQVIRAVDRDQISSSSPVRFSLPSNSGVSLNFTIQERGDHTANLLLLSSLKPLPHATYPAFQTVKIPIILQDGESALSSMGTVTVTLCPCENGGMWVEDRKRRTDGEDMMEWERQAVCSSPPSSSTLLGFTSAVMLAVLASSFILAVVVAWSLSTRKRKRDSLSPVENDEIRENIIRYDVEGGGEEDTAAFDITALKSVPHGIHARCVGAAPLYSQLCYSIHALNEGPFSRFESRPDRDRLTQTLPRGHTLNPRPLRPGSALTRTNQNRTREECDGSAESQPGDEGVATSQNQASLIQSDSGRPADPPASSLHHLHSSVSSPAAPENITSSHGATPGCSAAPFRTMEGTLLRAGAEILTGTTFVYPKTAQDCTQHPVGLHTRPEVKNRAGVLTLTIDELLRQRLDWVTFDPMQPPYDSLRMYEYEGAESEATSLSSIESQDDGGMEGEVFKEWEPKFQKLLEVLRADEKNKEGKENKVIKEEGEVQGEEGGGS